MNKKERFFWIIFYTFPIIANICIITYFAFKTDYIVKTQTKIGVVETNNEKKWYCVQYYHRINSKNQQHTNIYSLESGNFRLQEYKDGSRIFTQQSYPKKDVFFQYSYNESETAYLYSDDKFDGISYNKERQEMIVHYSIPEYHITVKKDEIHGIKVTYISQNTEESQK